MDLQPHKREMLPAQPALLPSRSMITDPAERAALVAKYRALWNLPESVQHCAAPSPVSLDRADFPNVLVPSTMCSLKCDGVRYLLLLASLNKECVAVMIDRNLAMYEVEVWAHEDFYTRGTLLDGELVWEYVRYTPKLRFVVFDIVACAGVSCIRDNYATRLQRITTLVHTGPVHEEMEQDLVERNCIAMGPHPHELQLSVKKCVPVWDMQRLWDSRNASLYKTDGIIFMLHGWPVGIHTYRGIYKWKSQHTVDVLVRKGASWTAHAQSGSEVCDVKLNERVTLVPNEVLADGAIVECDCEVRAMQVLLHPLKKRLDKEAPNTLETIARTIGNVRERITIEELCAYAEKVNPRASCQTTSVSSREGGPSALRP